MGAGSFQGVKRSGRGADPHPPSMCRGHERVELYLYSPSGPQWPVIGRTFTFNCVLTRRIKLNYILPLLFLLLFFFYFSYSSFLLLLFFYFFSSSSSSSSGITVLGAP
jgi:hypothetical protein